MRSFSAAAYFFGREIQSRLKIPIGLVQSAVSGTRAELWTPLSARMAAPGFKEAREQARQIEPELRAKQLAQEEWEKKLKKHEKPVKRFHHIPMQKKETLNGNSTQFLRC